MKHLVSTFALAITIFFVTPEQTKAGGYAASGASCVAANQHQAFDLMWDHFRIYNPSQFDRWVICPLVHILMYNKKNNIEEENSDFGIYTYHNGPGEIQCIIRAVPVEVTNEIVNARVLIAKDPGPYPKAKLTTFKNYNLLKGLLDDNGYVHSLTCKLPPLTGINALGGGQP